MNAPPETIPSIDTARSKASRARILTILEQLKALEPKPVEHVSPAPKPMSATDAQLSAEAAGVTGVVEPEGSA